MQHGHQQCELRPPITPNLPETPVLSVIFSNNFRGSAKKLKHFIIVCLWHNFCFLNWHLWAPTGVFALILYTMAPPLKCAYIHLLKAESFSELIEDSVSRGGHTSKICDITASVKHEASNRNTENWEFFFVLQLNSMNMTKKIISVSYLYKFMNFKLPGTGNFSLLNIDNYKAEISH